MKLDDITSELLARALEIYLPRAYPAGQISEAVRQRSELPAGQHGAELLADARFERVPAGATVAEAQRFNLRLGNAVYLHMKLGVDRVSQTDEYVLMVDTHDKHFAAMVQDKERAQFAALLDHNRRLHQEIEQAWTAAGLPTFENYLRATLSRGSGKKVT